jgi:subtilisin family serine protease
VVVFAAGNDNREIGDEELQALPGVLCVSAIDNYGYSTSYTNFGPTVDVSAPSATVSITPSGDTTTNFGGTSAAAPVVAGLAAWIVSMDPTLSAREVSDLIVATATESPYVTHDSSGHHAVYGYGIINPTAILEAIRTGDVGADSGEAPETGDGSDDQTTPATDEKGGCSMVMTSSPVAPIWILGSVVLLLGRRKPATSRVAR